MNWKLIWRGIKTAKLRNKLLIVFGLLLVFRLLAHIPIPIGETDELRQFIDVFLKEDSNIQLLNIYNLIAGGALASLSIMIVGLSPYITASIVMQVLTRVLPNLEKLQKEGEFGRKKINQYTRLLTLPLAIAQSILMITLVRELAPEATGIPNLFADLSLTEWAFLVTVLTTGAMILMWLGELITEKGIGNGISLLITISITTQIPFIIDRLRRELIDEGAQFSVFGWFDLPIESGGQLALVSIIVGSILLTTFFVVYLNEAQRRIKLSYAKRIQGNRVYSDVSTFLPIKLISAGVIPIIFAAGFLSLPQLIGTFLQSLDGSWAIFGENLLTWFSLPGGEYSPTGWQVAIYPAAFFLLIVAFTYFYTNIVFSPKDISERLQRQGGFIEDVRPGLDTQKYLAKIVSRLNFFGSISLGFLAIAPILAQLIFGLDASVVLGGTAILILVSVALETLRQIESQSLVTTYEDYEPGQFAKR